MGLKKMRLYVFKIFNLIIILIFITNCSIDTKTGIWDNKKEISTDTELSSLSFDENLTFDEFKNNVIIYGKKK